MRKKEISISKIKLLITTGLLCLLCNIHIAGQDMHNIILWGSGGYSTFLTDAKDINPLGNVGLGIGAGYELHYKKFLLKTGAEFTFFNQSFKMDNFRHDVWMKDGDIQYNEYLGHFDFTENKDFYQLGNINIPLMFGFRTGRVYLLAGGKIGLNVFGTSTTSSSVVSSASYPQFIDEFGNMPDHYLRTLEEKDKYPAKLGLDASLSLEVGFYLNTENARPKYRLALFCDYGLLNLHDNSKSENLILNKAQGDMYQPVLNSFMISEPMKDRFVNQLYVGLKFTIEFGLESKHDCLCDSYNPVRAVKTRKGKLYK